MESPTKERPIAPPEKPPDEPPPPPPPPAREDAPTLVRGARARARVAQGVAIIGLAFVISAGIGCAAAAGGASLAQSALEDYHILPTAGAAPDGQAAPVIGAISVRGAGLSGTGKAGIELVHVNGKVVTSLYKAEVSVSGCAGLELSAEGGTFRLIRTTTARALQLWPVLPCVRETALSSENQAEVLFAEPLRGDK